jgi:hypothetical protein
MKIKHCHVLVVTPVILATQEAEIRRITVRTQPQQTFQKTHHKNRTGGVAQDEGPIFKPQYTEKQIGKHPYIRILVRIKKDRTELHEAKTVRIINKTNQSCNVSYRMIPFVQHSGTVKTAEIVNTSVVVGCLQGGGEKV